DLSAADARFVGKEAEGYVGWSVAMGDVNGDGTVDILLGSALLGKRKGPGTVLLFYPPVSGIIELSAADGVLLGENEGDQAGTSLAVGKVDGDEAGDILVGAAHSDGGGSSSGAAYLLFGPVEGTVQLSKSDVRFVGEEASDGAGNAVAFGDFDADGDDDLLIGAEHAAVGGENSGSAYLLLKKGL
ncbi:MAG: FG-GAP repeat protein, partial [Deltaproteobacteria bacterium]|nr:FG-GAP repeat protein [Deltaproteobacteria bacterium]